MFLAQIPWLSQERRNAIEHQFTQIRRELATFLPLVGEKVLATRQEAAQDPHFARLKADRTIVTKADELSETLIRQWIQERFPNDSIRGEELPDRPGGPRMWIIDPIDGTYNFNHHGKMFSISVGLADSNIPKLGVLFYPSEDVLVAAAENAGATMNGQPLTVLPKDHEFGHTLVYRQPTTLSPEYFSHPRFARTLQQQSRLSWPSPTMEGLAASFTFAFLKFLQGGMDAILHPGATPYDIGAMCAIAKETGLPFSGYDGETIDFSKDTISIVVSKNIRLHEQIIKVLNS